MDIQRIALRKLVFEIIGDANHIDRQRGLDKLAGYEPTEMVPTLIEVLLDQGRSVPYCDDVVEGIARFLWAADAAVARPCAPAIVHLLATNGAANSPDPIFLLDVLVRKVPVQDISYAIPTLLDLMRLHAGDEVSATARDLLAKFSHEQTLPYQVLLNELNAH